VFPGSAKGGVLESHMDSSRQQSSFKTDRWQGLRANDISESPTAVAHGEPGIDFQVIEENVVEENVTRTYNLFKTVDILLSLLKPGHEVDKYDLRKIGNIP
jgi:hypothetical protein